MERGMVIYIIITVLAFIAALTGIYYLIYQRHINKALKDPENAKKKRFHLPSLGISSLGMWFFVWLISVIMVMMLQMDTVGTAREVKSLSQDLLNDVRELDSRTKGNTDLISGLYHDIMTERYVNNENTEFSLDNFDPETGMIELKVVVTPLNMQKSDKLSMIFDDSVIEMTPDYAKKTFSVVKKVNPTAIDDVYAFNCTFISEVSGIKQIDQISKINNDSLDRGIPLSFNWEAYYPDISARVWNDEANDIRFIKEENRFHIDSDFSIYYFEAEKVKDRRVVKCRLALYVDGEEKYSENVSEAGDIHIKKDIDGLNSNSKIDLVIECEDNYGCSYRMPVDILSQSFVSADDKYIIKDKNGNVIYG